jgi:vacuolar-type H+-ATPase subunit F/Vma7
MASPVFIGDEVAAAGFRLVGVELRVPQAGDEAAALADARASAPLVMVDAAIAARIAPEVLRAALRATSPITVVVPDLQQEVATPDISERLRRQLGIDA